jgi:lipopolysaccharide/colanic/teichoic acid biosynthesis glycosyltransferase
MNNTLSPEQTTKYMYINGSDEAYAYSPNELSVFYIGKDAELFQGSFPHLRIIEYALGFQEAADLISRMKSVNKQAIIIDLPYNGIGCALLNSALQSSLCRTIPVLYNLNIISEDQQCKIISSGLTDDFLDPKTDTENIIERIQFLAKVKGNLINGYMPMDVLEDEVVNGMSFKGIMKRFLDIIVSLVLLVVLSPIFLLIAIAIKLESRGSIFYNSYRAGQGFRVFKFFKFRTMRVDADILLDELAAHNQYNSEYNATFFKLENDPRVTYVGSFLRKSSLDELPQLLNVLKGDMSLVGNRPLPLYEAVKLTTDNYVDVSLVLPALQDYGRSKKEEKSKCHVKKG